MALMRSRILFWPIAFIASASCTPVSDLSQPDANGRPMAVPASLSPTFPRSGVDHVVTYVSWRGWGPRDGDRAIVARHGALVRLETRLIATRRSGEAEVETSFSNLATGASMSVARDAQGALAGVSLWQGQREEDQLPIFRHRLVQSREYEEIAGERCAIWRAEPETGDGVRYSACVSADGVLLRDTVLSRDGSTMSERRAISVERRPVAPAEVLPPREALDWSRWARMPPQPHAANYALSLAGRGPDGGERHRTFLADGVFKAEEQRTGNEITLLTIAGAGVGLTYSGERPQLTIARADDPSGPGPDSQFLSEPMADREPLRRLGEVCNWTNASVGVSDFSRIECRTADGLPLIVEEHSWGSLSGRWEAVSLSRGRTSAGSLRPRADLLNWTRWGWPMLDGRSPPAR
jgi:hypothetical protein